MSSRDKLLLAQIPRLRRYARALAGNRHDADDLVQTSLERAIRNWRKLREPANLRAWLFTILRNTHSNQRRRAALSPVRGQDPGEEELHIPVAPSQEGHMVMNDLTRAIGDLNPEMREVLLLVALEGFSYREVAHITDVPLGTVMSRLSRGRAHLRTLLEGEDFKAASIRRVK